MAAGGVQPTVITWNLLLASFGTAGDWMAALDILAKVQSSELQHVAPSAHHPCSLPMTHMYDRTYVCTMCLY